MEIELTDKSKVMIYFHNEINIVFVLRVYLLFELGA